MERLWAPWRMQYITSPKTDRCLLCSLAQESDDEKNLILLRGEKNYIMLNAYPYNPGHLMVVFYRHIGNLEDSTDSESIEHFQLTQRCISLLKETVNPNGFNIGLNIGKIAGAGIEDHLHTHIVPRWSGDVNFMPVIGETRVVSESLQDTYRKLKATLKQ